jgi:hypothetical protein
MKILFLHDLNSIPGGVKPTYLKDHGHSVLNPTLPDEDFDEAVKIAQDEFDRHHPDVVVGPSRGGAVAMNIKAGDTPLVLLCPAWKRWGTATKVKSNTVILHSKADEVVPFADSQELVRNSGLPWNSLIVVGLEHRLADDKSLKKMVETVEMVSVGMMTIAPEPILKAGLMTVHWATVFARNWTCRPDVSVKMVNDLMEAIHEVPSILIHWNDDLSLDMLIMHLSWFDEKSWNQQIDNNIFNVPNLVAFFRDRLEEFSSDEGVKS